MENGTIISQIKKICSNIFIQEIFQQIYKIIELQPSTEHKVCCCNGWQGLVIYFIYLGRS